MGFRILRRMKCGFGCSDSLRTRETLEIMQAQYSDLSDAEVRFLGSFYSVAAMDGQTAQHIQENVLKYSQDDITTIMYVLL